MLDKSGFDLWADGYDRCVTISDEEDVYPFAGYKKVLGSIYADIHAGKIRRILDVGFGTGVLTGRLYGDGYEITGVDFSQRMLEIAKEKMPRARLILHDFSGGLPLELRQEKFDAVVCTYAMHHWIGDVAFETRKDWEECRESSKEDWDDDEFYLIAEEIRKVIPEARFEKVSCCSGILRLEHVGLEKEL